MPKNKLLLHSCCAPCSTYVLEYLKNAYENCDITLYYYNPCIMPEDEYRKRLSEQKRLISMLGGIELIEGEYDNSLFLKDIEGLENEPEGKKRCEKCIEMRLLETARVAENFKFDCFTTTLSVSPHKNAEFINLTLKNIGTEYGIKPILEDFKKNNGFKRSIELSKQFGLYRQNYCGCIFSKKL